MEQTLELVFKNAEGDTKVITVTDPREGITAQEADEAMDIILAANVIETSGGDNVGSKDNVHCFVCFLCGNALARVSHGDYFSVAFGVFKY